MKLMESLEKVFDHILRTFIVLACILLALVTLSVFLEVILRYVFDRPQVWVIELSEYSLLYITFLGAAWVLESDGHVKVDLFTSGLNKRGRAVCSFISFLVCFVVSVILTLHGSRVTWDYFSKGIYNPTILEIPTAAILLIIPLSGATLMIQSIRGAIRSVRPSGEEK